MSTVVLPQDRIPLSTHERHRLNILRSVLDGLRSQAQEAGGLSLGALACQDRVHDLEDIALLLAHGDPVWGWHVDKQGSSLAWARRTFLSR